MFVWLEMADVVYFHQQSIDEYGGLPGDPKDGPLESTLARPQNLLNYNPAATVFELASSYGFGLVKNHCFPDGNKRIALICIDVFLQINGYELNAAEADAVATIRELAAGEITEEDLATWIEKNAEHFDIDAV